MDKNTALMDQEKIADTLGTGRPKQGEVETVDKTPKTQAQYIEELKGFIESVPCPNEGRIQELRDLIRKGKLITKESLREAAQKLTQQFLR